LFEKHTKPTDTLYDLIIHMIKVKEVGRAADSYVMLYCNGVIWR